MSSTLGFNVSTVIVKARKVNNHIHKKEKIKVQKIMLFFSYLIKLACPTESLFVATEITNGNDGPEKIVIEII